MSSNFDIFQYEFEQEMLKHVHDLRNELRENGWVQRDSPESSSNLLPTK